LTFVTLAGAAEADHDGSHGQHVRTGKHALDGAVEPIWPLIATVSLG
jgi:hypothetical protein